MPAFNDYCIVCDKLCLQNSVYCSDSCRLHDQTSSNTSPMLSAKNPYCYTSPLLKGREEVENENNNGMHLLHYDSPILPTSHGSNCELDNDYLTLSYGSGNTTNTNSNKKNTNTTSTSTARNYLLHNTKSDLISDYLSSTSLNYKKWLNSTATIERLV
ncbi:hypothetical protein PACTADRAFT_32889 [Pachysolen tannophilus NRRL Y-2460]|uniref:Uncharacterized protein n=1 Tax=Pachysolen tannophilus NRRL Y-2460 TaxID=669874 RepID=A0A1E4U078_PACTA|nr:hypothetical protein PACTADRAFT_32889 [Pachysolen tannophilus NRRL Y-2460]